jgi:hypothetical protein
LYKTRKNTGFSLFEEAMKYIELFSSKKDICEKKDLNFRTVKKMIENDEIAIVYRKYKRKLRKKDEYVEKTILC